MLDAILQQTATQLSGLFWMTQLKGTFHCLSNAGVEKNGQIQAAEAQIHTSLVTIQGQIHKPTFPIMHSNGLFHSKLML